MRNNLSYIIRELSSFTVSGKRYEFTNSLTCNKKLAKEYWNDFNSILRKQSIRLGANWCKYAFTERKDDSIFYFIAIPLSVHAPSCFTEMKTIESYYLTYDHVGDMNQLASTINHIFKELIPCNNLIRISKDFIYFERYDHRFKWNKKDSVIEINVPIIRQ